MPVFMLMLFFTLCLPGAVIGQSRDNREYWIESFFSVSYPLRDVEIVSGYGMRPDPITRKDSFHRGIDLKASVQSSALSMFDGVVKRTGQEDRAGKYIIMIYGRYEVSYCHLSNIYVVPGDTVLAGDIIGTTGNSGRTTGKHLHLTVKKNQQYVNPLHILTYIRDFKRQCCNALNDFSDSGDSPREFILRYAPIAIEQQQKFGIPASVTLSQMAHESQWGRSSLARRGLNFFGIKASKSWIESGKPYSLHDDDRRGEAFCNYNTVEESVAHHSELLMSSRYKECRLFSPTDYHNWLMAIKRAGYATAKDYVQCCERIIRKYRLDRYDYND